MGLLLLLLVPATTTHTHKQTPSKPKPPAPTKTQTKKRVLDRATLLSFARHHETGAPMPAALFDKLVAAGNFRAASTLLRQVNMATKDLVLHSAYAPGHGETVFDVERRVRRRGFLFFRHSHCPNPHPINPNQPSPTKQPNNKQQTKPNKNKPKRSPRRR
jgi:hypothetical protein